MSFPVLLRNGQLAQVRHDAMTAKAGFPLMGRLANDQLELWTAEGYYRENHTEHPLDIVRGVNVALTAADLEKRPRK